MNWEHEARWLKEVLDMVNSMPACNTCGKAEVCEYRPPDGHFTRINCPLYEESKDDSRE